MKTRTISIIIVTVAVLVSAGLYLTMQPRPPVRADAGRLLVMGTFARIIALAPDRSTAEKCIDAAVTEINAVDELMSDYKEDSEISQVNAGASDRPVRVSESTFEVLQKSLEFSKLTDGAFDVTVGPISELWGFSSDSPALPEPSRIAELLPLVGYRKLDLSEDRVRFRLPGMKLDLGGAAKGYAVDRALELLRASGARGALVNAGGDLGYFGTKPGGGSWRVAIAHPRDEGVLVEVDGLKFEAVATSGDYQRFFIKDGVRYHHILDPLTGYPARACVSSTVWARSVTDADILSTAVFVMGPEKGLRLIEGLPGAEALVFFEEEGKLKYRFSSGLRGKIKFERQPGEGR